MIFTDQCSIPGSGRSPGGQWQPTPVLLPGKSHGWRSLVGYSPWGHKESDTTSLSLSLSLSHSMDQAWSKTGDIYVGNAGSRH